MIIKKVYRVGQSVYVDKPDSGYIELNRLVAEEGMLLVCGAENACSVDVPDDEIPLWSEVDERLVDFNGEEEDAIGDN